MTITWTMVPKILSTNIFCPLIPLKTQKIKIFKKSKKKARRYYHFTHVYHKRKSYDIWFLKYWAWRTEFFVILDHFLPFYPNNPKSHNFEKMTKLWIYYSFTQVYHKWKSYDVWFDKNFCYFGLFFAVLPPNNSKSQNFEKLNKNPWRYNHFIEVYQKWWSYAILFLKYGAWQM